MIKRALFLTFVFAFLLTACQPQKSAGQPQRQPVSGPPMEGCSVTPLLPTPDPTLQAKIPLVQADDHTRGPKNAPITIIEYSDFQCPYCAMVAPVMEQLAERYPDDLLIVNRHFPLNSHPNSLLMAYASEAAALQGKFYEMEKVIFASQDQWAGSDAETARKWVIEQAGTLGLDTAKFQSDLDSQQVKDRVQRNLDEATAAQLPGTPFLFINGLPYQSDMSLDGLTGIVELFKLEKRQYTACPPMVIDPGKQYEASFETEKGTFTVKLYADKAPLAVNSFVFLARDGWFNNIPFHRVLPGFVAQAGDPSGSGYGGPGYFFKNENPDAKFDREGLMAMANAGPDTNGSQFFITYAPADNLNGGYTIFGEVIDGMDVVKKLTPRDPQQGGDLPPADKILTVTITEK